MSRCYQVIRNGMVWLLTQQRVNARLIYLVHGIVGAVCTLALVTTYICAKAPDANAYCELILTVAASTGSAAAGHFLVSKNNSEFAIHPPDQDDDTDKK